jgi:hypothetical protein
MPQNLFNGPQQAGDTSLAIVARDISQISVECSAAGSQGATVSAVVILEGSNTGNDWIPIVQLNISGTTRAVDGGIAKTNWSQIRGRVVSISDSTNLVCSIITRGFPYGT